MISPKLLFIYIISVTVNKHLFISIGAVSDALDYKDKKHVEFCSHKSYRVGKRPQQ